jgi:aldehyde dehydrogenase (NAD+)
VSVTAVDVSAVRSESFAKDADREYRMFIDGEWAPAADGRTFRCVDPYLDDEWGSVPIGGAEDVDGAVRAARRAFDEGGWPQTAPAERARLLRVLADLIEEHAEELALSQIHENGKLLTEMSGQARGLARAVHYYAGIAETYGGQTIPSSLPNVVTYTLREPVGVVAAITPWNSPLSLLGNKLFPALAAGCTIVAKPSEVTPTSTLRFAELMEAAGFPRGVFNVVTGAGETGAALAAHPGIDKIAFTGSTATGRALLHAAADRVARVSLELGGKSPNIVFADADLENAVEGAMGGVFAATGQTCVAGSRLLVQKTVHDEFAALLAERASALRLGDPLDEATDVGPVASRPQLAKVLSYVDIGRSEGAQVLAGGTRASASDDVSRGLFVEPTVFAGVDNRSRLAQEEIFGPVVGVIPFEDEDDAVRMANDVQYGLAAGVWTENVRRAHRMIGRLRAGMVWVNTYRIGHYAMPFGGYKQSGLGREHGPDALHEYTEVKSVFLDLGNRMNFSRRS